MDKSGHREYLLVESWDSVWEVMKKKIMVLFKEAEE